MNPLRGRRQWGSRHAVSTGSQHATLAALDVLQEGGNAFDAAIAASAVMTVVLPAANGPAGDMAAILHVGSKRQVLSLTGLGRAPSGASLEAYRSRGLRTVPETGILAASTPGVVDGWYRLRDALGSMPLTRLLEPAKSLAQEGVVVSDQNRRWIADNHPVIEQAPFAELYKATLDPSALGSVSRQPGLATLFDLVGRRSAHEWRTELARAVTAVSGEKGGFFEAADLLADVADLRPAMSTKINGREVFTNPAPTQGPIFLQHLVLTDQFRPEAESNEAAHIHLRSEIINQSYGWRLQHLGDPRHVSMPDPLSQLTINSLASRVNMLSRSESVCRGAYHEGDTTHLVVADEFGNSVSWIQSLGLGFGAGVGVPELGMLLSNRLGRSCTLRDGDPNACAPGRTPVNTIFAWAVLNDSRLVSTGGTPGGDGQTQWNLQTVGSLVFDDTDLLEALTRPKWTYYPGPDKAEAEMAEELWVDEEIAPDTISELEARGHVVVKRPTVGGVTRAIDFTGRALLVLDDGRQEGVSLAV